jgi:peptide/nickel transport system permease protein
MAMPGPRRTSTLPLRTLFTLWVLLTLNFLLPRLLPGDPLSAQTDPDSGSYVYDGPTRAALEQYYGLDQPPARQYLTYLAGLVKGDLGQSIRLKQPVAQVLAAHLPWTLLLTLSALLVASLAGIWAGSEAAWRSDGPLDRGLTAASVVLGNIPVFLTGTLLLIVFAVGLRWFPLAGGRTPFASYGSPFDAAVDIAHHLFLPALTLTLALLGGKFLLVRGSMRGVMHEDFMLVARAKGLPPGRLKRGHGLRNAILPFVHGLATSAAMAITGALFIETLFDYPGMGRLIFDSVDARDYPVLQGAFVLVAALVLAANLLADWLSLRLDPRLREAAA